MSVNDHTLAIAKFEMLFYSASSAMALLQGENFIFEIANTEYLRLVNNRQIFGKSFTDALPEIADTTLPKIMKEVWSTGEPFMGKELLVRLAKVEGGPLFDWYFDFTYSRLDVHGSPYGIYIHAVDVTEKVQSRHEIENAQRKLHIALESAKMGTWDLDIITNKVTWSEKTSELFGVDPIDDLPLQSAIAQVHPDDQERVLQAIADAVNPAGSGKYSIEYRTRKPDGTFRLLNVIGRAYFNDNAATHFTGIAYDIGEERQLQIDIENRELEFRSLANSIPQMCFMADETGAVYWYNQRWFDYTGTTLEEMKDWGWKKVMDPITLAEISERWKDCLKNQKAFEMTFKIISKHGDSRWFLTRSIPIFNSSGKLVKWIGSNTDVDDQIRIENELQAKSRELEAILGSMLEGLVLADQDGNLLLWNNAALKMHRFNSNEEASLKLQECPDLFELTRLDGEVMPLAEWPLSRILEGEKVENQEIVIKRKDTGYSFVANYSGSPLLDDDGKVRMAVITVSDITDLIENRKTLQKALQVRDEFLSVASHELKTPLTALIMQTQLQRKLSMRNDSKAYDKERLTKLFEQNERLYMKLNRLIEDMLDISRIRTGKLYMHRTQVNLCDLTNEVLERLRNEFLIAGLKKPELKASEINGEWDVLRIEQVITNLLTNAIRYGQGKPVKIWVEEDSEMALLHVQDQGLGIAQEDQEKIFDRFERAINSNEVSGLGLGLYIANQITREHGGFITLKSTLGKGSTFTLHLPKKPIS